MRTERIAKNNERIIKFYFEKEKFKFTKGINHNFTSETWTKLISKWSGVKIENCDMINFSKKYGIASEEVCPDLYCYGIFK